MPEATDLLVPRGDMTAGLWIRRVGSPAAVVIRPQRFVRPDDNKENVPPEGYVGPTPRRRRRQRARKSPLPEWYPRTPLRDITVIVNVRKLPTLLLLLFLVSIFAIFFEIYRSILSSLIDVGIHNF